MTRTVRGIRSVRFMDDPRHELIGGGVALIVPTAFDPAHLTGNTVLSNANLTATNNGAGVTSDNVRTVAHLAGKKAYGELLYVSGFNAQFGFCSSAFALANQLSVNAAAVGGLLGDVALFHANVSVLTYTGAPASTGQRTCYAYDGTNGNLWLRVQGGNWNNSATANPDTNTEGFNISSLIGTADVYFVVNQNSDGGGGASQVTANFGATGFTFTKPATFGATG